MSDKKRIRMLTPIAGVGFAFAIGDEPEIETKEADRLIAAGYADPVNPDVESKGGPKKASKKPAKPKSA